LYLRLRMNYPQKSVNDDNFKSTITSAVKFLCIICIIHESTVKKKQCQNVTLTG